MWKPEKLRHTEKGPRSRTSGVFFENNLKGKNYETRSRGDA
jgi:hypothetical protein